MQPFSTHRRRILSRAISMALIPLALSACATKRPDTALQLIRHQQELQTGQRQHESHALRKKAGSEAEIMLSLIRETQEQGRHFAALAYIDAYIQTHGRNARIDALRANALRMTDQANASETAYRSLLEGEEAVTGWHGLGLLAAADGDFASASGYLEKAAGLQPSNPDILNDLGFAWLQAGELGRARLPLGQAAELAPNQTKVLANLALLLLLQGQEGQAQALMDKAGLSAAARKQVRHLQQTWLESRELQPVRTGKTEAAASRPSEEKKRPEPARSSAAVLPSFQHLPE